MKIKTFETILNDPKSKAKVQELNINQFSPPPIQVSRNSGRTYESDRPMYRRFIWELLEQNEFLAYQKKAKTNTELQREFLLKFPRNQKLRYRFKTYKATIGMFRKRYNNQQLFASQPPPYLLSFQYDELGFIVVGGIYQHIYMTFDDCYRRCLEFKVADPRFVPPEYIVEIRNRQIEQSMEGPPTDSKQLNWLDWIVPDEDTIKRLCTKLKLKQGLYNSVRFPKGCTREETPIDDE